MKKQKSFFRNPNKDQQLNKGLITHKINFRFK